MHGRHNYKRIARMVTYFFYKNLAFGLTLFDNLQPTRVGPGAQRQLASGFNIFFVSLPVLALGAGPGREPAELREFPPLQAGPGERVLHARASRLGGR